VPKQFIEEYKLPNLSYPILHPEFILQTLAKYRVEESFQLRGALRVLIERKKLNTGKPLLVGDNRSVTASMVMLVIVVQDLRFALVRCED
jgi:hypothetical protein